eukprot:Rmarinus@m.16724
MRTKTSATHLVEIVKKQTIKKPARTTTQKELLIGAHVSAAGGVQNALTNASKVGARSLALFTRSQRRWESPPLKENDVAEFKLRCNELGYSPQVILPHGSYLINCGSANPDILSKSKAGLIDEMQRCEQLGLTLYNFHPGSAKGSSVSESIRRIAECINEALQKTTSVTAVLENTAGQGHTIGNKFEHLRDIIALVDDRKRVGVCLDTCHLFAAGYDLKSNYHGVMDEFEETVGFRYLRGVHLNDSKFGLGSRRDRHANIGEGCLGVEVFRDVINDARLRGIPMVLETENTGNAEKCESEIALLRSLERK